jgi:hypothetical protein
MMGLDTDAGHRGMLCVDALRLHPSQQLPVPALGIPQGNVERARVSHLSHRIDGFRVGFQQEVELKRNVEDL